MEYSYLSDPNNPRSGHLSPRLRRHNCGAEAKPQGSQFDDDQVRHLEYDGMESAIEILNIDSIL